jgi:type I restriction enzyme M protein
LINVKDLKSDPFDFNVDSFSKLQGNKKLIRKLPTEALLVSKIFSPFKVSYVKPTVNSDIYVSQNLRSFEVNLDVVNLDYLMYVLNTTFFEDQIRRVAQGSAMKTFSIKDFLSICIDLPSIPEQKLLVLDAKKLKLKDDRTEFERLESKLLGVEKLHRQDSSQFKHSMAQFLSGINSGVKVLRNHLTSIDGSLIDVNKTFGKNERSIDTLMNQLILKVEDCNNMLLGLGQDSSLGAKEEVVYTDLIHQLKMSILPDSFKVLVEDNIAESEFSDDFIDDFASNPLTINVNVGLFKKMFQNIIDNAVKHGFVDKEKQHLLKISSSLSQSIDDKSCIILEISNNGLPFPKDYDKKKFITKWSKSGDTANTGLGGSDINSVVNSFNGTFDLELDANTEYPVKYIINIPIEL